MSKYSINTIKDILNQKLSGYEIKIEEEDFDEYGHEINIRCSIDTEKEDNLFIFTISGDLVCRAIINDEIAFNYKKSVDYEKTIANFIDASFKMSEKLIQLGNIYSVTLKGV